MSAGGFQYPGRDVQLSDPAEKCREDGHNGLPSLSGSGQSVRGGGRAADGGSGDIILGESEIQVAVFRVCGLNGDEVAGSPSTDASHKGSWREVVLVDHGPWQRNTIIQDGLFNRGGGGEELSYQGV